MKEEPIEVYFLGLFTILALSFIFFVGYLFYSNPKGMVLLFGVVIIPFIFGYTVLYVVDIGNKIMGRL